MSEKIPGAEKKVLCGIFGILLGSLGIHKFILGYTKEGIIQIVVSVLTCGVGGIIGFIEGIIYLTKSDEDFVKTYITNKRGWF
jgi:TM2 domain-containing membrane protein YozV